LNIETFKELILANVTFNEYLTYRVVIGKVAKELRPKKRLVNRVTKRPIKKLINRTTKRPIEKLTKKPIEKLTENQRPNI